MRAAIYARFSSEGQREESIAAQIRACLDYAEKKDCQVVEKYIDRALSGKSDKRPEFQRMMEDSKNRKFDILLVHKYDRFSRNRYDHAVYGKELEDNGIDLVAVAEDFGTGKEASLMQGILQSLSQYYIENLSEEIRKGHKENALKAVHNGGYAPFGYYIVDQKYYINELEASYVRRMYEACINKTGYKELVQEMNNAGIRGRRGKAIKYSSIYEILRNEKYAGTYTYKLQEGKKKRDKTTAIRIENALPSIIDKKEWEEVQKIMDARKNNGRTAKKEYLLSGKVLCGECGASMYAYSPTKNGNTYSYYQCSKKCGIGVVRVESVDDAVFSYFKQLLSNSNKERIYKSLQSYTKSLKLERKASGDSIKKQIDEKQRQIDVYIENMGKSSLPEEILKNMGEKIMELKEQIATLETEQTLPLDYSKQQVINYLTVLTMLDAAIFQLQRDTIQTYLEFVEIKKDSIEVFSTFDAVLSKGKIGRGERHTRFPSILFLFKVLRQ